MKTKTFLFLPLIFLIACEPSASEIDAKVKAALENQQDSITNSEKLGADSIAKIEAELSKSQDNAVVNNELQWNYSGSIDKYKIKAQVNYGKGTNSEGTGALEIPITGYYFYESQNQKIQIEGRSNGRARFIWLLTPMAEKKHLMDSLQVACLKIFLELGRKMVSNLNLI